MIHFDPMYFVFLAPGMLLALWAQWRVRSAYHAASQIAARSGATGAETAYVVMRDSGVHDVAIEPTEGVMTDHYVPGEKILRLSSEVYGGRSIAALGIAAHEAGHAMQDAERYPLMGIRNAMVPLANFGGGFGGLIILVGFVLQAVGLILVGIAVFSLAVLFQLVNLPVEFDASRRAKLALQTSGLVSASEEAEVSRVLDAAAWTYVAATLTSVMTLAYYLFRASSDR